MMLKVLIAVDGSEHAEHAIDAVADLARNGCDLAATLLNVRETPLLQDGVPVAVWDDLVRAQRERQDRVLDLAEQHARESGLTLRPSLRAEGFASDEIVRAAREQAVDQLVLGTRGMGSVRSLFIGSVAQRVVHGASVPVLLVK